MDYELSVLGVPKTVDNDLAETDHAPGFGSAARFVASMVRDSGKDLSAMRNFESVRVIETMGRNVGWLALSSTYFKRKPVEPPHLVYVPESSFGREAFLEAVHEAERNFGYVVVVVSEGLVPPKNGHLDEPLLGGVSRDLAALIVEELGLPARGELLGMGQRSYSLAASAQDRQEAWYLGRRAVEAIHRGESGNMLTLVRTLSPRYEYEVRSVPFERVAGVERALPKEWTGRPDEIHESFQKWLGPLIGDDLEEYPADLWEDGRP